MPTLWERIRNLKTDDLSTLEDVVTDSQRREIERQVKQGLQDRIIESPEELQTAWRAEIPYLENQQEYDVLAATNRGIVEGLNTTLSHLQHLDPDMQMRLQPGQIESDAKAAWQAAQDGSLTEQEQSQETAQPSADFSQADLPKLLLQEGQSLVDEWRHDIAELGQNPHDIQLYFAGRIDQHNSLIEQVETVQPELRETLPPRISFEAVKSQLEQEQRQQKEVPEAAYGFSI